MGMKISCSIPSSREIPLSLNLGAPVVISEPKSAVAKQLQQLSQHYAPVETTSTEGVAAMSLSERINQAQQEPCSGATSRRRGCRPPSQTLDRRRAGRLQGQGARRPLRAPRHPAVRGDERRADADARHGRDRRPDGRRESALSPQERQLLVQDIARDVMGLGPIEQFLNDPTVSEIMVNGSDNIYVERAGIIERTNVRFISEEHLRRVIERIVSSVGRRIDESSPMVDARLADGSRVNVIVPPLSLDGSILTIRKFAKDPFTVRDLIAMGTLHRAGRVAARRHGGGRHEHPRLRRYRHRQDHAAQRAVELHAARGAHRHHRGRRRAAAAPGARRSASRPGRRTSRATGRSPSATSSATRCACGPIASSSARSAAPRRSTCCRR